MSPVWIWQRGLMPVGLDCQKPSEGPSSSVDVSCLVQHHFHCGCWHALNICSPFPAVLSRLNAQPLERYLHAQVGQDAHSSKPRDRENLLGTQMPSISGAIQGDDMESWLQASPLRHWVQGCTRGSLTQCLYSSHWQDGNPSMEPAPERCLEQLVSYPAGTQPPHLSFCFEAVCILGWTGLAFWVNKLLGRCFLKQWVGSRVCLK